MNVSSNTSNTNQKYYDFGLNEDGNGYWFVTTDQKPKIEDYALSSLTKIENIIKEFKISFKKEGLDSELVKIAEGIYKQHESEIPFLAIKIFYMKDLNKVWGRIYNLIQNLINPPESLPLISDIIQITLNLLTPKELTVFNQVNHTSKNEVDINLINRAKKTGYVFCKEGIKAGLNLRNLNRAIKKFCKDKLLDVKDISYKDNGEVNSEKTLENMNHLTTEDLFTIFSKQGAYDKTHMLVRRFFYTQDNLKPKNSDILSQPIAQKGINAIWASVNNLNNVITRLLLNRGAKPNVYGDYLPLEIKADLVTVASLNGNIALVELLLKNGANSAKTASNGSLALHFAAERGHLKIVQLFLNYDDLINKDNGTGGTALSFACYHNREDVVKLLLKNGADIRMGMCLLQAIHKNFCNIVEILLESHAEVNEVDGNNQTPLHWAVCKKASNKILKLLLEKEALIDAVDNNGNTPLLLALIGKSTASKLLIEEGANVNCVNKNEETPLILAVKNLDLDVVRLLLEKKGNSNAVDNEGNTALHFAVLKQSAVCQLLIDEGAQVNSVNENGETPLMLAVQSLNSDAVKLLLENKADANFKDKNGRTSLHLAAAKENVEILQLLVEHGGDVNFVTPSGITMLHSNIRHSVKIAKFLVGKGVNVNGITSDGNTALHNMMIKNAKNDELMLFLLENGADINQVNHSNESSLELSCKTGDWNLVKFLIDSKKALNFEKNLK